MHPVLSADFDRFPYLARHVSDAVSDFIREGSQPCEQMLRDLVACEHAYINIEHPDFIGGSRAIARVGGQGVLAGVVAIGTHLWQLFVITW